MRAPDVLNAADTKQVQEVLGMFLFHARTVDSTMLVALDTLAVQQSKGTRATMIALTQLLNCAATHPDACILFWSSSMCLHTSGDESCSSVPKARSRAAGFHCLSNHPLDPQALPLPNGPEPPSDGATQVRTQMPKEVLSSASKAKLAALFHNGKEVCPSRACLEELGHPQPPTPLQTDNSAAAGSIANDNVKQKRSKAIDMCFHWIPDRAHQGQFLVCWRKGVLNKADCFAKHHPTHHRNIHSSYLHSPDNRSRNCFERLQDENTANAPPAS